jgi:Uncharacterized conserved protein
MLIEKVLQTLPKEPIPVREIVSGLHWTAVASRYCGLASSLWSETLPEVPIPNLTHLIHLSAQELAQYALSSNHLESAIGMAAVNSLLDPTPPGSFDLNAHDWLTKEGVGKKIAMVGHFPFAEKLAPVAQALWILEKNPRPGDHPASESKDLIPEADIVAITGSAFVNHSIDEVLSYCSPSSIVLVLGPSTPLAPALFTEGISMLSGTYVTDEPGTLKAIRNGGTYHHLLGVRRMTILKPESAL